MDGDNLLGTWRDRRRTDAERRALAGEIGRLARRERRRFVVVFDGYSVGVKQLWGEGYCLVGNATEFLDPVFSSGITLALESSSRAVKVLDRQLKGEAVESRKQLFIRRFEE